MDRFQILESSLETYRPKATMVVPVRDDEHILVLLDSLEHSTAIDQIEVSIILNFPSKNIKDICADLMRKRNLPYVNLVNIRDPKSIGDIRNAGIYTANSPFVIHMDSDCTVAPNYIELMINACSNNPDIVVPRLLRDPGTNAASRVMAKHFEVIGSDLRGRFFNPGLGIRKDLHTSGHMYSEQILFSDDREFMAQLEDENPQICYLPDATLIHKADDAEKSAKQTFRYGLDKGKISEIYPAADDTKLRVQWIKACISDNHDLIYSILESGGNLFNLYNETCTLVDLQNANSESYDLSIYLQVTGFISSLAFGYYLRFSSKVHPYLYEIRSEFIALGLDKFDRMIPMDWLPQNYIY